MGFPKIALSLKEDGMAKTYRQYRIHPGIGIARLGNSPGDETPENETERLV